MSHTITVAQARGVLILVLGQAGLPYIEFTPPEVKKTLTGYGNAQKIEVQEAVARELALDFLPHPDDAADAERDRFNRLASSLIVSIWSSLVI